MRQLMTMTQQRNEWLDALRLIAAFGVVWIHSFVPGTDARLSELGRFAVPFFVITSMWLMARLPEPPRPLRDSARAFTDFARGRFIRLYVPFLVWNVLYSAARVLKSRWLGGGEPVFTGIGWFLGSAAVQLWFLPFLLVAQCVAKVVLMIAARGSVWRAAMFAVTLAALLLTSEVRFVLASHDVSLNFFVQEMNTGVPVALAALAVVLTGWHRTVVSGRACRWCVAAALVLLVVMVWRPGSVGLQVLSGLLLAFAGTCPTGGVIVRQLAPLGLYAFGIYLVHNGVLDVLRLVLQRAHVPGQWPSQLSAFALTCALSLLLCIVVSRLPGGRLSRWLGLRG